MKVLQVVGFSILVFVLAAIIVAAGVMFFGPGVWWVLGGMAGFVLIAPIAVWGVAHFSQWEWLRVVGADEVLAVTGIFGKKLYIEGVILNIPFIMKIYCVPLNLIEADIKDALVYTKNGVPLVIDAAVRIEVEKEVEEAKGGYWGVAAKYPGQTHEETVKLIRAGVHGIIIAHQLTAMGGIEAEEIIQEEPRKAFREKVISLAREELGLLDLSLTAYGVTEVRDAPSEDDKPGYLETLRRIRMAEVTARAEIAEHNEREKTGTRQFAVDIVLEQAKQDFRVTKANIDKEVDPQEAAADIAYDLAYAERMIEVTRLKEQYRVGVPAIWNGFATVQKGLAEAEALRLKLQEMAKAPELATVAELTNMITALTPIFPKLNILTIGGEGADLCSSFVPKIPALLQGLEVYKKGISGVAAAVGDGGSGEPSSSISDISAQRGGVRKFAAALLAEVNADIAGFEQEESRGGGDKDKTLDAPGVDVYEE